MTQHEWHLGQTSAHYEGHGPGTISNGTGDYGGVSYGTYQFSTEPNGGSLKEFLRMSTYGDQFKGLEPTTPEFNAKWKELAQSDPAFAQDQYDVMKKTHYDRMVATLKADGLDMTGRGPAVQDALWSTSVQFGPDHWHDAGGPDIFEKGLQAKFGNGYTLSELSDKDIVIAVQDYKIAHNEHLFKSSSPSERASVLERAKNEKVDLLNLAAGKAFDESRHTHHDHRVLEQDARGEAVHTLQTDLAALGYTDGRGHPLKADGDFGIETRHAVECFQHDHHLTVDGIAGPKTQHALDAALQEHARKAVPALDDPAHPAHAGNELAQGLRGAGQSLDSQLHAAETALRDFSHPEHPQHALYASLKERLPAGTSEPRLAQVTAACHAAHLHKPEDVGDIYINDTRALFLGNKLGSTFAEIDLTRPVPSVQQSVLQAEQYDRQQERMQAQFMQQPSYGFTH